METVLIAGGSGFIGSHLCELFLEKGHRVICVDNLITGRQTNISHLQSNENFTYKKHDITQPFEIDEPIHFILNFASPASPKDYAQHPIKTLLTGAVGTQQLLELTKKHNATFLLASTSEVYGDPSVSPQSESYNGNVSCTGPRSCYDEAKRFAEAITMAYRRKHKLNTRIVRIFNTYGPRMKSNDGRVIPNFITQALKNEPITLYGSGEQTRSFCYVKDEIEGIFKLLMSNTHEPVNIGNPNEYTILQLAEKIKQLTGSTSKLVNEQLPEDDPQQRKPDTTKAKEFLDWEATTSLDEGLKKTIEWFKEN